MQSYKEANKRLNQTGNGMKGLELSTFQEWITKNVCKYYFVLDLVMKNRPNVKPWYTNEDNTSSDEDNDLETRVINQNITTLSLLSDEESMESVRYDTNDKVYDTRDDVLNGESMNEPFNKFDMSSNIA